MSADGLADLAKLVPKPLVPDFARSFNFYMQVIEFKQLYVIVIDPDGYLLRLSQPLGVRLATGGNIDG